MSRNRTNLAAQFFSDNLQPPGTNLDDDDDSQDNSRSVDGESNSASDKIVELLNFATLEPDASLKLDALRTVQELLLHKDPNLLDNFLDEVIGFQKDRSQDVRKFLIGFIEASCKKDPDVLPKVITNLQIFMTDDVLAIRKRVIQAMTNLYTVVLGWLCKAKTVSDQMVAVWQAVQLIKDVILHLLDSDNDGMRTHAVKFMEMLVIAQTHSEGENGSNSFSLDDVPLTLKIARPRKLEEEAFQVFDELVKYHGSPHISSANLMICMGALTNVAKMRSQLFMSKVIVALEMLHANLPPTLSRSQVSSVRKFLKNQLLSLLKTPFAGDNFFNNISTLLFDLGATREEITKVLPRFEELKRRARKERTKVEISSAKNEDPEEPVAKRGKVEEEDDDDEDDDQGDESNRSESAVDITEKFIMDRLNPSLAAELVMSFISFLPSEIPAHFHNMYTPIADAGTESQVRHVARMLAAQMTAHNIGPGVQQAKHMERSVSMTMEEDDEEEREVGKISTLVGGSAPGMIEPERSKKNKTVTLMPAGLFNKKSLKKSLKLTEITKPLQSDESDHQMQKAVERILKAEKVSVLGGVKDTRTKIITTLVARFPMSLKSTVLEYLFEDLNKRMELAFSWLYEEYCFCHSFHKAQWNRRTDDSEYNSIYCQLIHGVIERTSGKDRQILLRRLYLESPMITEEAIELLKQFVQIDGSAVTVVNLMRDLVRLRPTKKLNFLNFLLEFCSHQTDEVRQTAIQTVLKLHQDGDFREIIEDYSIMYLSFLNNAIPPTLLFGDDRGRPLVYSIWTEEVVRACLYLFLSLFQNNLRLFKHLANVFKSTKSSVIDAKTNRPVPLSHTILRELDGYVAKISMEDPELMNIIETCPEECELLVNRIIHVLTDKTKPTQRLVDKVKEIYQERNMDIRFLIPVLNGLTKQEVTAALPKLIKLSQPVVKEVFTRLWNKGPLSPTDLLIALHNIEVTSDKEAMRAVLQATKLCFQEKNVYTQEVLAIVLQQLMELPTIPVLFMRTVIQTHTTYPRIIGFVMNILQRLIVKQVWKQKLIWDGFIKCCERTVPQSYAVMLQLPPQKLSEFLGSVPALRDPLLVHVQAFTESQRAHISSSTMKVLYNVKEENPVVIKQEKLDSGRGEVQHLDDEPEPPGM